MTIMTTVDELLDYIFDGKKTAFYREFESWVLDSRRFKAFAIDHRAKIRAKLKNVARRRRYAGFRCGAGNCDVAVRSERFALEYEKYAASKQHGPDYTVTFRTHTPS